MPKRPNIDSFRRKTARRLRMNATDAEATLWRHLRKLETEGTHFRRQVPIGPYVADFACMAARIVIEVDGSQHGEDENKARDDERTRWLESEGYRVVRFWNNDLVQNIDGVLDVIYAALYGSRDTEPRRLMHERRRDRVAGSSHPTPARSARRPSPSRGG
jgi:very-short-patch-repair endonuclease